MILFTEIILEYIEDQSQLCDQCIDLMNTQRVRDILSNPRTSQASKKRFMVEKAGGYCSMCGDIATQIASYDRLMLRLWRVL